MEWFNRNICNLISFCFTCYRSFFRSNCRIVEQKLLFETKYCTQTQHRTFIYTNCDRIYSDRFLWIWFLCSRTACECVRLGFSSQILWLFLFMLLLLLLHRVCQKCRWLDCIKFNSDMHISFTMISSFSVTRCSTDYNSTFHTSFYFSGDRCCR